MSSFADQLKSEIARIARKEVRSEIRALKKANAQYRADIAALKRRLQALERVAARLAKGGGKAARSPAPVDQQCVTRGHAAEVREMRDATICLIQGSTNEQVSQSKGAGGCRDLLE